MYSLDCLNWAKVDPRIVICQAAAIITTIIVLTLLKTYLKHSSSQNFNKNHK